MLPVAAAAASSDESATQHTLQQQQLLRQTAAPKPPGATCWLTHACCAAADNAACHPRCPACAWVGVRGGDRSYAADSGWPWAEPQATAACHREPACCCWAGYLDHCQSCCCHCWVYTHQAATSMGEKTNVRSDFVHTAAHWGTCSTRLLHPGPARKKP
jgi:hypothetical protein